MYGYKDVYFNKKHEGFRSSIWIELIGFDNTAPDYGVGDFLSKTGFVPDMVSLHLTSISFVMTHRGMESETRLPAFACSYCGHAGNDDRKRQEWTNYQMRGLIEELRKNGVETYISMFDFDSDTLLDDMPRYSREHPEISVIDRTGHDMWLIHMLKSFDDGVSFESRFIEKLTEVINDYKLAGIQLADGVSSPRLSLQRADFSPEYTKEFFASIGVTPPEGLGINKTADLIFGSYRREWITYNTERWRTFMDHVIKAINATGAKAAFNSAWTKGPLEAIYRYGTDYKSYYDSGADSFIVEDVAADLFFLSNSDNGFEMGHERRKFIHYEFASNMMQLKALLPTLKLTPLCMIRDTLEQWDVLHHMPTAMQRAVAVNLNNYYITADGSFVPVTNGPHYCLGDGLTAKEWDDIRMMWDNAFTENVTDVRGVTVVWSDKKLRRELDEFIDTRLWYNGKWTAELLSRGAAVHKITRVENLSAVKGPILVINPALFDDSELDSIRAYNGGDILSLGLDSDGKLSFNDQKGAILDERLDAFPQPRDVVDPHNAIWTDSLTFMEVDPTFVDRVAEYINKLTGVATITRDYGKCHVNEVMTSATTSRFFVDNEEYYYAVPTINTHRRIKNIKYVTKPDCYPIKRNQTSFSLRVPGFGMDIIEIEFED